MFETSSETMQDRHGLSNRILVLVSILAILLVGGYLLWHHHSVEAARNAEEAIKAHVRAQMVATLKEQMADRLNDPDSVEYRKTVLYRKPILKSREEEVPNGTYALCGELNGKNRMGGYVGYRRFVSFVFVDAPSGSMPDDARLATMDESDEFHADKSFDETWNKMCQGQSESLEP